MKTRIFCLLLLPFWACHTAPPTPSEIQELKFDFNGKESISYEFTQFNRINWEYDSLEESGIDQEVSVAAELILNIKEGRSADFIFKNLQTQMLMGGDTISNEVPIQAIPGFNEYGENEVNAAFSDKFMEVFPLPYREKIDKKVISIPANKILNAQGVVINFTGTTTFTLEDTLKYKGHSCLKIKARTLVDQIQLPTMVENPQNYQLIQEEEFEGYFDYVEGYYVEGKGRAKVLSRSPIRFPEEAEEEKFQPLVKTEAEFSFSLKEVK